MLTDIALSLATLCYLLATVFVGKSVFVESKPNLKAIFALSAGAIVLQLIAAKGILFSSQQLQLSFAAMCLLINVTIVTVISLRSLSYSNLTILFVTYLFSALLSLVILFIPADSIAYVGTEINSSATLFIHISLSIAAYCILVIASLYALQFRYIDNKLKAKTLSLHSHLPPLNMVEKQQFRLMAMGLILLTLALVTGFVFLEHMWDKQYIHKTVLSIVAWVIFAVLTFGHKIYGWRGNNSAIATVIAAIVLTLAYFGSRFVREIILIS